MPDSNPTRTPIEREQMDDGALLAMLMETHRPWSIHEIAREVDAATETHPDDSLRRLYGAGLIHRHDGFVWPTRAAVIADEIAV